MVDTTNLFLIATWDSAQMNIGEVEGYCERVAVVLRKLVKKENWGRRVSDVFSS